MLFVAGSEQEVVRDGRLQPDRHRRGHTGGGGEGVVRERGRQGLPVRQRLRGAERQGLRHHHQPVRRYRQAATLRRRRDGVRRPAAHRRRHR